MVVWQMPCESSTPPGSQSKRTPLSERGFLYLGSGGLLLERGIPMRGSTVKSGFQKANNLAFCRLNGPELCEGHQGSQLSQKAHSKEWAFCIYGILTEYCSRKAFPCDKNVRNVFGPLQRAAKRRTPWMG